MIKHHLNDATLMSYAAGSLPEALCAVVVAHTSNCSSCAKKVRDMELVGSLLFDKIEPVELDGSAPTLALRGIAAEIDSVIKPHSSADNISSARAEAEIHAGICSEIPAPLAAFIGNNLDDLPWKRLGFGVWHAHVGPESECGRGDLRLIKVAPGQVLPEHTHGGTELTLVLRGSYKDEIATFGVGDVEDVDGDTEHQPVSDAKEGCICLIASESPAKYRNLVARLVQPLTGL